jgi:hypothetical protein
MKSKILTLVFVLAMAASSLTLAPAMAKPNEVTVIVKDQSTKKTVERALIIINSNYYFSDADGKIVIHTDETWVAGDSYNLYEPESGMMSQVGSFTLHNNYSARVTVFVNPLN